MLPRSTKLTRKGQVTIPKEIRDELDMHEGEYLLVEQVDGRIILRRAIDIARETAGVFKQYRKATPIDPAEERAAVERAIAEEVAASMRDEYRDGE